MKGSIEEVKEEVVSMTSEDIVIFVVFSLPLVIKKEGKSFTFTKSRVYYFIK